MSDDILFHVLPAKNAQLGEIVLNRPKALNALTYEMCSRLHQQLQAWKDDASIKAIIVRSTSEKAFCAGGDIRKIYENGPKKARESLDFFKTEYRMDAAIHDFPKPYISLLNGITMGGGAGISVNGSHRVATENFLFAMPETGIGFFPDIGSGYFLNQCPGKMGYYLAMTGTSIRSADAFELNLVTHTVAANQLENLVAALQSVIWEGNAFSTVNSVLSHFIVQHNNQELTHHRSFIEDYFSGNSASSIVHRLSQAKDEWAKKIYELLASRCPTSIVIAFEQLNRVKALNFSEVMQVEFDIAHQFLSDLDFYEGIRAMIIDRDHKPRWNPSEIEDVSWDMIERFFAKKSPLF